MDLRDGAHGGAGVVARGLLVNGDGRGKPLNALHLGLVHHAQKLPGVAGEAFHVAPLPLGVDGVKGQGAFPRAGNPGDDDELAPGKLQADVLQVVLPSAPDDDAVHPWKYTTPRGMGVGPRAGVGLAIMAPWPPGPRKPRGWWNASSRRTRPRCEASPASSAAGTRPSSWPRPGGGEASPPSTPSTSSEARLLWPVLPLALPLFALYGARPKAPFPSLLLAYDLAGEGAGAEELVRAYRGRAP